jgi:hypothetical protein
MADSASSDSMQFEMSDRFDDPRWDAFLAGTPLGHFQQSSLWAQVKAAEGWRCIRYCMRRKGELCGGWQLLWKESRLGRIGYISKGPVFADRTGIVTAMNQLQDVLAQNRIRAITVQPPDDDPALTDILSSEGFITDPTDRVVRCTLVNDLTGGPAAVEDAIYSDTRRRVRQGRRRGMVVRCGTAEDLGAFFELMVKTCRRQGVLPNPPSLASVQRLWEVFSNRGLIHLFIAQFEGKIVAGLLCIQFGQIFTLWKKGWSGEHGDKRPNELLTHAALIAGASAGFAIADFAAFPLDMGALLIAGGTPSPELQKSRHFFNRDFGGRPKILPPAQVFIRNRLLRKTVRRVVTSRVASASFNWLGTK